MKKVQKIAHVIVIILLAIIGFVLLYFAAVFCLSRIPIRQKADTKPEVTIFIRTNGAHVDIVVPVRNEQMDWSKEVKYKNTVSQDSTCPYLAIGWGDKGFYLNTSTWSELKFSVAFKAVFWLSTTAMHATYYKEMTESKVCKKIEISKKQYVKLVEFITNRFQKDAGGHFINIKTNANYGNSDAFYEAKGRYNLFYTCNTWSNEALKVAGQKCCVWTIFDTGIFRQYN